jgi:23S rRNA pseudouridine2604 synthase
MTYPVRINKYLADQKIASRREADAMIETKKVIVNGRPAVLGQMLNEGDTIELTGVAKKYAYIAYYKGRGIITHSPAEHETDVITKLKNDYSLTGLSPIGRLDKDSEGLMLLSNDGRITGPLLDPEAKHEKEYEVTVDKPVTGMFAKVMEMGVDIEGYRTKAAKVTPNPRSDKKFNLVLTEGKKHQIRRMCAALGYQIQTLKRVRIMNIELGELKPNQYRKVNGPELDKLLKSLKVK